ncbi:hypothetical protein UlMin_012965 [Ulmus minor]
MGDRAATLAKAITELEEMYSGIPDESVDLTLQDLAKFKNTPEMNKQTSFALEPISETTRNDQHMLSPLQKLPSLDFNRGLQAVSNQYQFISHDQLDLISEERDIVHPLRLHQHHHHGHDVGDQSKFNGHNVHHQNLSPNGHSAGMIGMQVYDHDHVSGTSMSAVSNMYHRQDQRTPARRRPGIPHSKICTLCSTYIYIFRHRCLVCGRVYCRQCVNVGMGEMTEGRKCVECLGRKFSHRYIQRAGQLGCCGGWRYPSEVTQAELKWAEKGPRRNAERAQFRSGMMSTASRSPMTPRTPTGAHTSIEPDSFVASSTYSPYTPSHRHYPF